MRIAEHRIAGDCLEGVGIPGDGGIAVIDRDAEPRVFDIVWCNKITDTVNGFLKEIVQTGEKPVVRTHYKDKNMDYIFFAPYIYGVVLKVLDKNRNVVWERPQPTKADDIRAMSDEEMEQKVSEYFGDAAGSAAFGKLFDLELAFRGAVIGKHGVTADIIESGIELFDIVHFSDVGVAILEGLLIHVVMDLVEERGAKRLDLLDWEDLLFAVDALGEDGLTVSKVSWSDFDAERDAFHLVLGELPAWGS